MIHSKTLAAWALGAAPWGLAAACLSDAEVSALMARWTETLPAANPEVQSEADAACTRAKLNALQLQRFNKVIGYKAGLTNPAVQKRFNHDQPVWGKLFDSMVLDNGAVVDARFGARPLFEADLLVRVKSAAIQDAKTPLEVLQHIDQIIPFIELPDLVVETPSKLNGAAIGALNVGARLGVAGQPIQVPATRGDRHALHEALRDMTVVLSDHQGNTLGIGKGGDIMDHPLNAVVWLAQAIGQEGLRLQPGDVVSLGSFSPLLPPKPGLKVVATYQGLPGAQPVSVQFK